MEITEGTPRVLTTAGGMMLTQAGDVDMRDRIVTDRVYLAVNDDAGRWREITMAEADSIRAEQRAAREKMMDMIID